MEYSLLIYFNNLSHSTFSKLKFPTLYCHTTIVTSTLYPVNNHKE